MLPTLSNLYLHSFTVLFHYLEFFSAINKVLLLSKSLTFLCWAAEDAFCNTAGTHQKYNASHCLFLRSQLCIVLDSIHPRGGYQRTKNIMPNTPARCHLEVLLPHQCKHTSASSFPAGCDAPLTLTFFIC